MTVANLRFVDSPATAANTRLDLQAATTASSTRVLHADLTIGAPDLAGDPDSIGAQWGFRTLTLRVMVDGTRANALPVLASIAREVTQRPTNWLMFQLGTDTIPVWFKTYRTSPGEISFENVTSDTTTRDVWQVEVHLDAEPFAYGALTTIPAQTITNDPWTGTNPCVYTLPAIKGDAPAPVILQVTPSVEWSGFTPLFSMVAYDPTAVVLPTGSPAGSPVQARRLDTIAGGNDTAAYVTAAGYVGGGYRECTFATVTDFQTRLSGGIGASLQPGRYKVLCWVYRTDSSSVFNLRLSQGVGNGLFNYGPVVPFDRATGSSNTWQAGWADMGDFSFPANGNLDDASTIGVTPTINIYAQRVSGTGKLRFSALMVVPVDMPIAAQVTTFSPQFGYWGLQTDELGEFNGETQQTSRLIVANLPIRIAREAESPPILGDYLEVVPRVTNMLVMLQQTNLRTPPNAADNNGDIPTTTASVTLAYYPRYLWLADA